MTEADKLIRKGLIQLAIGLFLAYNLICHATGCDLEKDRKAIREGILFDRETGERRIIR